MENNNFLANRLYTAILRFKDGIDTEEAWKTSNWIVNNKDRGTAIYEFVVRQDKLKLSGNDRLELNRILLNMIKGRKSFQKFYNSKEARDERNKSLKN